MTYKPAQNARLPLPIVFYGRSYESLTHFLREVHPPPSANKNTVIGRIRRGVTKYGSYDDSWLEEALYLPAATFQAKHGRRKTWVTIDGVRRDLASVYGDISHPAVSYSTFYMRMRKRRGTTSTVAENAASMEESEWTTHYGGGRRKTFVYQGDLHPGAHGIYTGVSSFLRTIGRYDDRQSIWSRLARGWDVDEALTRPPVERENAYSIVYLATQRSTGRRYVGVSVRGLRTRWSEHVKEAFDAQSERPLYKAMRETGVDDFEVKVVEEGEMSSSELAERERKWIQKLRTQDPTRGFNVSAGGSVGLVEGSATTYGNKKYQSRTAAAKDLAKKTGLPQHVIMKRLRDNRPLPLVARKHSKHPEAGSLLYRKWQSLLRRSKNGQTGPVDPSWMASYDQWKEDTSAVGKETLNLIRPHKDREWGPDNYAWGDATERVTSTHGREICAFGVSFPSISALLREYGLGNGTFQFRLDRGMSIEEALTAPLAATSRRGKLFTWEGEQFRSATAAARVLAERHSVTEHMAKDRIARAIPTSRWGAMAGKTPKATADVAPNICDN